jgi:hypothetical protein
MAKTPATPAGAAPTPFDLLPQTREVGFDPLCSVLKDGLGTFSVRPGVERHDAIAVAEYLLAAAEDTVAAHIENGMNERLTYLVAFALAATRTIHSAVGFEP